MVIIGLSGDVGSFSEEATLLYIQQNTIEEYQLQYLIDMDGVFNALAAKQIDIGILPVVNSISGLVDAAFYAMGRNQFEIIGHFNLKINQCLMTKAALDLDSIKEVYSYPPALKQCGNFLTTKLPLAKLVSWFDTAKAARDLATGALSANIGVIASKNAAQAYGLNLMAENIQDSSNNITTFIVVKGVK